MHMVSALLRVPVGAIVLCGVAGEAMPMEEWVGLVALSIRRLAVEAHVVLSEVIDG